ncbi:beta-L-arabinofuranosidase domain-containing protein [Candidatus Poribacteria bacterium]
MLVVSFIPFLIAGVSIAEAADIPELRLNFWPESEWFFEGSGQYEGWSERRDLFVLYHPWEVSQAGYSGAVSREVQIPDDWKGGIRLHFYMTDDYHGEHPKLDDNNWLGQMSLIGHRFKQILVDGEVIWEVDVADPEGVSVQSYFSIPLPERVEPGDQVRIEFRLIDKVGSSEHQGEDYRHIGTTDGIKKSDPWRFMTHVYVGDVMLTPESVTEVKRGESPSTTLARQVHEKRWPLEPYGQSVSFPVPLDWEGSDDAPRMGCVIRCGIPLPPGAVNDVKQIILRDETGQRLELQLSPMNYWPDGSLCWVELDTITEPESAGPNARLLLDIDPDKSQENLSRKPVSVIAKDDDTFEIQTGGVNVSVGGPDGQLLSRMAYGDVVLTDLTGEIEIAGKTYKTMADSARVLADGPVRGEVELSGRMRSDEDEIGRFVFRVSGMSGRPYVRMTWRIYNDRAETLSISRFELVGNCSIGENAVSRWGSYEKSAGANVLVQQLSEERFDVIDDTGASVDTGKSSPGWLGVMDEGHSLTVLVRHFRQQFPKALEFKQGRLRIALFEASEEQPHYLPNEGEAKRHEIWLGLWDRALSPEEMDQTARLFSRPGRLFNAEYFCASGGFGYAATHDEKEFADLDAYMKNTYGDIGEKRIYELGIRNWGDKPYQKDNNSWCNGYYDRQQGLASEYLMTGDPRWFDRLEATVRHIMDVDVCHASAEHPDQLGAIYSCYSVDHSGGGIWVMMQRTKGTLAYWRLTGDTDARDTALEAADFVIRTNAGLGRGSVRDHGGALYCLMAAYDETNDPKYLEGAKAVAYDAMGRIDRRRGCYSEVHGNISYRGNVPWMVAQLAQPMYEYYRSSGDVDAAMAVVGMAESMIMENCTRGVPGDVYGYSHNPHFKKTSGYHVLIAPAILYAYELTGDDAFLEHGRAMYAQTIQEKSVNAINNCYWNVPTLLYYLKRFGLE